MEAWVLIVGLGFFLLYCEIPHLSFVFFDLKTEL